jgi:hypothetical protein
LGIPSERFLAFKKDIKRILHRKRKPQTASFSMLI